MFVRSNISEPADQEIDCIVREATCDDFEAINRVKQRNELGYGEYADWARLWSENPFRFELQAPLGWVLESKTQGIVGTLSNIPRMYVLNGEPVRAAAARAWAVDKQFRSAAVFLANKFFSQKNIDLFLNTSASPEAAAIFKAFKCSEIPGPPCEQVLFWIVKYTRFAAAYLRKARKPALAGIGRAAGAALYCQDLVHRPKIRFQRVEIQKLTSFDERFDVLWELLRRRRDRLMAVRSSDALTWQFGPSLKAGNLVVFGVIQADNLSGYLIMRRFDHDQFGLRRYRVVDMQAVHDDDNIVLSLMSAALEYAEGSGVDVVEAMGFHKTKRNLLEKLRPRHRLLPACPYLYRVSAHSHALRVTLENTDAWDPSPFDGDASL